jgi:hypothetical protein
MRFIIAAFLVCYAAVANAQQGSPVGYLSQANNNATIVLAGQVAVSAIVLINTTTTVYYLKLYDKATAPVCGTDIPKWRIPIPYGASNSGGGVAIPNGGLLFYTGFGFCLTAGIADNDNTSAATGIALNFGLTGLP